MITYPCAKINLGLNVVSKRPDGYHNIETVFYPIPLCDKLEIFISDEKTNSNGKCILKVDGNPIDCDNNNNLVTKAYNELAKYYKLPNIKATLEKNIPSQAGLGGGSSDAAYMLRMINEQCVLNIKADILARHAGKLGADCAFFIKSTPAFATGIGDILSPIFIKEPLKGCYIAIIKPDVSICTKEAYAMIKPNYQTISCNKAIQYPLEKWKELLSNDFEKPAFQTYPFLAEIKEKLYDAGAIYAQMSGSGSAIYGIFKSKPTSITSLFPTYFNIVLAL